MSRTYYGPICKSLFLYPKETPTQYLFIFEKDNSKKLIKIPFSEESNLYAAHLAAKAKAITKFSGDSYYYKFIDVSGDEQEFKIDVSGTVSVGGWVLSSDSNTISNGETVYYTTDTSLE